MWIDNNKKDESFFTVSNDGCLNKWQKANNSWKPKILEVHRGIKRFIQIFIYFL